MTSNADRRRRVRTAFIFLTPSLIGVVLFLVIPVIFVMVLSLTQWNLLTPAPHWPRSAWRLRPSEP